MDRLCTPEVPTEDVLVLDDRGRESGDGERLECRTDVVLELCRQERMQIKCYYDETPE